jgi:hypothetical protein
VRELEKKVTFYNVNVEFIPEGGNVESWQLMMRYSDFLDLYATLNSTAQPPRFPFPRKSFLQSANIVEDRRIRFQTLLQTSVCSIPLPLELFLFLEINRHLEVRYPSFLQKQQHVGATTPESVNVTSSPVLIGPPTTGNVNVVNENTSEHLDSIIEVEDEDDQLETPQRQSLLLNLRNRPSRLREYVMSEGFQKLKQAPLYRSLFFLTILLTVVISIVQLVRKIMASSLGETGLKISIYVYIA